MNFLEWFGVILMSAGVFMFPDGGLPGLLLFFLGTFFAIFVGETYKKEVSQ